MKRGIISCMRREQGGIALPLLFALVLPLLLGLMPAPAVSAQTQLVRDIESSVCETSGQGGQRQQSQHDCCDCCILCPAGTSHAALPGDAAAAVLPPQAFGAGGLRPAQVLGHVAGQHRDGLSARGPPIL